MKKNIYQKFNIFFIVLLIIGIVTNGLVYGINLKIDNYEKKLSGNENINNANITKKKVISALFCGINGYLTDTIMYVRYNVETGNLSYMSIPRDTYINNSYAVDHKINSIYRKQNIEPLIEEVEEQLDVDIDYYAIIDNSVIHDLVDVIGGVEVDVRINMKYDDPTQDLHIDIKKGKQVLNGEQAEHFIRFRKGNDGSGYRRGDIERIEVQHEFIKALIKTILKPENLLKIDEIIKVGLENTKTNLTLREALKYTTDISKFNVDNIYSCTAIGTTPYIDNISYFKLDKFLTRNLLKEHFNN